MALHLAVIWIAAFSVSWLLYIKAVARIMMINIYQKSLRMKALRPGGMRNKGVFSFILSGFPRHFSQVIYYFLEFGVYSHFP